MQRNIQELRVALGFELSFDFTRLRGGHGTPLLSAHQPTSEPPGWMSSGGEYLKDEVRQSAFQSMPTWLTIKHRAQGYK